MERINFTEFPFDSVTVTLNDGAFYVLASRKGDPIDKVKKALFEDIDDVSSYLEGYFSKEIIPAEPIKKQEQPKQAIGFLAA